VYTNISRGNDLTPLALAVGTWLGRRNFVTGQFDLGSKTLSPSNLLFKQLAQQPFSRRLVQSFVTARLDVESHYSSDSPGYLPSDSHTKQLTLRATRPTVTLPELCHLPSNSSTSDSPSDSSTALSLRGSTFTGRKAQTREREFSLSEEDKRQRERESVSCSEGDKPERDMEMTASTGDESIQFD
jgi:hypothetical protein